MSSPPLRGTAEWSATREVALLLGLTGGNRYAAQQLWLRNTRILLPVSPPLLPVSPPLYGVATELTDGYAFGVTVLMALTGLPAAGIKQRCRHMLRWPTQPQRWQPPGVPDVAAGSWDGGASSSLAEVVQGLSELWAEERMPLQREV